MDKEIEGKLKDIRLLLLGLEISYITTEEKKAIEIIVLKYLNDIISVINDLGRTHEKS